MIFLTLFRTSVILSYNREVFRQSISLKAVYFDPGDSSVVTPYHHDGVVYI